MLLASLVSAIKTAVILRLQWPSLHPANMPCMLHWQAAAEETAGRGDSSGTPTAAAAGPGGDGVAGLLAGRSEHGKMTVKVRHMWTI